MIYKFNSIYSLFKHAALQKPKKIALFTDAGKITFEQLLAYSNKVSAYLQQHVKKGDNVGIFMDNCWQYIAATYAISAAGATVVPISSGLKSKELSYILNDANIKCMFCSERLRDITSKSIAIHQCSTIIWVDNKKNNQDFSEILKQDISCTPRDVSLEDNSAIFYTSGTTGVPKGSMLSNKNILATFYAFTNHIKMRKKDRTVLFLPMHISISLLPLGILPLCHGSSVVLTEFTSAESFLKTLTLKQVTVLAAPPAIHAKIVHVPSTKLTDIFDRIRYVVSGGSPLNMDIAQKLKDKFKKATLVTAYGLSESSILTTAIPLGSTKYDSVGLPLADYKVKIIDSYDIELSRRSVGQIVIKGDGVMKGYLNSSIDNPCSINNGWLYTGDMGYLDEEGYLYITGRIKDLIIYNSQHIYPREIEPIIDSFDGVVESAIVGRKDPICNEIPVAFITQKEDSSINIDKLKEYLKGFLAQSKIPQEFIIVDELPKNASGKVLKRVLKEQLTLSAD